jgi:hypothetical protein
VAVSGASSGESDEKAWTGVEDRDILPSVTGRPSDLSLAMGLKASDPSWTLRCEDQRRGIALTVGDLSFESTIGIVLLPRVAQVRHGYTAAVRVR